MSVVELIDALAILYYGRELIADPTGAWNSVPRSESWLLAMTCKLDCWMLTVNSNQNNHEKGTEVKYNALHLYCINIIKLDII